MEMKQYGLKVVAEKKYYLLLNSIKRLSIITPRIYLCSHFLGLQDEEENPRSEEDFKFYL
jgi:hypothetical protein